MSNDTGNEKVLALLAYFGFLFLVPMLAAPNSHFCRYHANQGLVLFLFEIALGIVGVIPILGSIVAIVGSIFGVVCFVMGIINALKGEEKPLPLIGGITIIK
ncbi:MAG: hypothetical protein LBD02_07725 [Christensenellaceae bacterium]|jgi:uncharacterized membrane protein|nr:hypothetical protein [Christensenellaceae bacterium]